MINFKPLNDYVLIKPIEDSTSNLILPDSQKERPQQGEVIAVGPGTKEQEILVSIGDIVHYGKYSGNEFKSDDIDYLIMRQSDIFAILE